MKKILGSKGVQEQLKKKIEIEEFQPTWNDMYIWMQLLFTVSNYIQQTQGIETTYSQRRHDVWNVKHCIYCNSCKVTGVVKPQEFIFK